MAVNKMNKKISAIQKHGKTAKGKKELIKYLEGGRLTPKQAIQAKCYDCLCYMVDGRQDCKMPKCSLYPFMTFNENSQKRKNSAARGQNMDSFALEGAK
jgi:hypothetical protein